MIRMRPLLMVPVLFLAQRVSAQPDLDSLWRIWTDEGRHDTVRLMALHDYAWDGFLYSDPDSAYRIGQTMFNYAEKRGNERFMGGALNLQANVLSFNGDLNGALDLFSRSLRIMQRIGYKKGIGMGYVNVGSILNDQGEYPKALDAYEHGLAVMEEVGHVPGILAVLGNIGNIYQDFGDLELAATYHERCYRLADSLGIDQYRMTALNNLGNIALDRRRYDPALAKFSRCMEVADGMSDAVLGSIARNNIGIILRERGDMIGAFAIMQRALSMAEAAGYSPGITQSLANIGRTHLMAHEPRKAIDPCERGWALADEQGLMWDQRLLCTCLYDAYSAIGDAEHALINLERLRTLDDSLHETETAKKLQRIEFTKETLADSLAHAEELRAEQVAHEEELRRQRIVRNSLMGGFALVAAFAVVFFFQRNRINKARKRSDELLLNILPEEVAEELKAKGHADAKHFDQVTILFTDFKGFTEASEKLSPQELVEELNTCFKAFDGIITARGIEKIKTIGDAYMCAGGLPVPSSSTPAGVVQAALEMQAFMVTRKTEREAAGKPFFEMRVGIHTGPVVAGIVGVKKFAYDIWGDTVNIASRMESSGEVGQVNISEATYELVKNEPGLAFTPRGKVQAKGKGEMEMYFAKMLAKA